MRSGSEEKWCPVPRPGLPLRLGTLNNVDHQVVQCLLAAYSFLAGLVVSPHRESASLPECLVLLLVPDLHRDSDLNLTASDSDGAVPAGVRHWEVRLIASDGASDNGIGLRLRGLPEPQPLFDRLTHRPGNFLSQGRFRRLVVERQHGNGLDRGRKTAPGKPVQASSQGQRANACEEAKSQAQRRPARWKER